MGLLIIKTVGSVVAMVIIWRLVDAALRAGIDGVLFFVGVAAVAGLGGYELRWLADAIREKKASTPDKE